MDKQTRTWFFILTTAIALSACGSKPVNATQPIPEPPQITLAPQATFTAAPTMTLAPTIETPVLQEQVCSPLEGETLNELPEIITQPFNMPRAGQDDKHHGVDFAFYRRKELLTIDGLQILSALDGKVVTVINDKYPYGNAVIIETALKSLSPTLLNAINIPAVQPTVIPDPKFNWVPGELPFQLDETERSLYINYAHLKFPSELKVGDWVTCGQLIGFVGNTGDSSNSHLHFETRVGPSGARFDSMAYYTAQSTQSERYNYVVWRVTNLFQLFDPMQLLSVF